MKRMGLIVFAVAACGGRDAGSHLDLPFYTDAELTPRWFDSAVEAGESHRVADFSLVDQAGRTITGSDLDGRIHVASFFFTSCGQVCPVTIQNLKMVRRAFADDEDVVLMSYSVTPEMDSVSVLRTFGGAHGIVADRWHLLTGDRSTIFDLAESSYFTELDDAGLYGVDLLYHTETVILVDQERHIRGVYNGTLAFDLSRLIEDVRTLHRKGG